MLCCYEYFWIAYIGPFPGSQPFDKIEQIGRQGSHAEWIAQETEDARRAATTYLPFTVKSHLELKKKLNKTMCNSHTG